MIRGPVLAPENLRIVLIIALMSLKELGCTAIITAAYQSIVSSFRVTLNDLVWATFLPKQ